MKLRGTAVLAWFAAMGAATALAQFGLYGSPSLLDMPQVNSTTLPHSDRVFAPVTPTLAAAATFTPPPAAFAQPVVGVRAADHYASLPAQPAPPPAVDLKPDSLDIGHSQPGPSVVDQMLNEPTDPVPSGPYSPVNYGRPISAAVHRFDQAACGHATCGDTCCQAPCCPWYGSVLALVMTRDRPNQLWTSYETNNNPNQIDLDTEGWRWGAEVRIGRRFCCAQPTCTESCGESCYGQTCGQGCGGQIYSPWALEAVFWTLDSFEGMAYLSHVNGLSTPLTVRYNEFNGVNAMAYFDGAAGHRLWRSNEYYNIELNLVRTPMFRMAEAPWNVDWLVGLRYFRFKDEWIFGSVAGGYSWGEDPSQEAFIEDRVTNDLFGVQLGFEADYTLFRTWSFFFAPKVGIYNNHIDNYFNVYLGDGTISNPTAASGMTGSYPVASTKDVVSFLTQIDVGVDWRFAPRWSLRGGYRVVVATGIALADNQIPPYIVDIPEIASIDTNGELILHGAFFGLTYNF